MGVGVAHEVWVGAGYVVYENSGPGGFVQRNALEVVLSGRKVIQIVARTSCGELLEKTKVAESRLYTPWAAFYTCQDFASEVATGRAQSFQRDGILAGAVVVLGLIWFSKN